MLWVWRGGPLPRTLSGGAAQVLECTHYVPLGCHSYPVVVNCHGNSGSRCDAEEVRSALDTLAPYTFALFARV